MSLLTTLAYAITAAVRPRVRDAEVAALKAQIDDLNRQAYERECRISDLNRQSAAQYRSRVISQSICRISVRRLKSTSAIARQGGTNCLRAMDTDFIEIRFGSFGMMIVWGPYGYPQFLALESLKSIPYLGRGVAEGCPAVPTPFTL